MRGCLDTEGTKSTKGTRSANQIRVEISALTSLTLLVPFVLFVPLVLSASEIELRHELDLPRSAGRGSEYLTKRSIRKHEVRVGHQERRRVGYVLRFNTDLHILRLANRKLLAQRHIEIEEGRTSEEVSAHVAWLTSRGHEELGPLLGVEEKVLTVLQLHATEIR